MIIVGYQGIGKTTLAKKDRNYIDLESSCMRVDGKRPDDWYLYYCNVAEELSRQGFRVFTSSHKVVRERLAQGKEDVVVIYPSLDLKDEWISKLATRYEQTMSAKDFRALANAKTEYENNIKDLMSTTGDNVSQIQINDIRYNLGLILKCYGLPFDDQIVNIAASIFHSDGGKVDV